MPARMRVTEKWSWSRVGASSWLHCDTLRHCSNKDKHDICMTGQVVDTTGAGDCFTAAYAVALLEGQSQTAVLRFAGKGPGCWLQSSSVLDLCRRVVYASPAGLTRMQALECMRNPWGQGTFSLCGCVLGSYACSAVAHCVALLSAVWEVRCGPQHALICLHDGGCSGGSGALRAGERGDAKHAGPQAC